MKISAVVMSVVVGLVALTTAAAGQETRYVNPDGGFSVAPPAGWEVGKNAKGEPRIWGPKGEKFTANMNGRFETSALPLEQYVDKSSSYILQNYKSIGTDSTSLESKTAFRSSSGIPGYRVVFVSAYKDFVVRTTQYIFSPPGNNVKYLLTYTSLNSGKTVDGPVFDSAAKTFKVDK